MRCRIIGSVVTEVGFIEEAVAYSNAANYPPLGSDEPACERYAGRESLAAAFSYDQGV